MQQIQTKSMQEYIAALKKRKGKIIVVFFILLLVTLALAFGLPAIYRSSATILIEQQEIPEDLVRSTVTSYADQRIQVITQKAMRTQNLWKIIEEYGLYKKMLENYPREVVIKEMREDIHQNIISAEVVDPRTGRPTNATIAFKLSYDSESPVLAQKIANEISSLYLSENIKTRKEKASETSIFLNEETEKLEKTIIKLEGDLARFKQENGNKLPELKDMNLSLMNRLDNQINDIDIQLRNLLERKIYLDSELAQINPHSTMTSSSGERILSPEDRLKVLQTQLISESSKYAENHPDLIRIKNEIKSLKKEIGWVDEAENLAKELDALKAKQSDLKSRYSNKHPDVKKIDRKINSVTSNLKAIRNKQQSKAQSKSGYSKPDNPAYIQLKVQLEATLGEIRSLKSKKDEFLLKYQEYEQRIIAMPLIEKDYRALLRNHEQAVVKHRDLKARLMEAKLGESLEEGSKGERFELIEPPLLPEKPIKPNRIAILAFGLILSFAASIGMALGLDQIDHTIWRHAQIKNIVGTTPLVAIPYIKNPSEKGRKWKLILLSVVLFFAMSALALFMIDQFYKPLDVLWYVIMRKAELMFI